MTRHTILWYLVAEDITYSYSYHLNIVSVIFYDGSEASNATRKITYDITLSTYFDTTDPKKLGLIGNICGAFSLFRLAATLGMGTERSKAKADMITAMLRERLFPNADNFCKLFAMRLRYYSDNA